MVGKKCLLLSERGQVVKISSSVKSKKLKNRHVRESQTGQVLRILGTFSKTYLVAASLSFLSALLLPSFIRKSVFKYLIASSCE